MPYYRLRSPSSSTVGKPVFLTWTLRESVPDEWLTSPAAISSGESFATVDRYLDEARTGPLHFRRREVAAAVVETICTYGSSLRQYDLHSFIVMPNHVHLLLTPKVELTNLTRIVKRVIAERANELLDQTGAPFWNETNWEHVVGDQLELHRIQQYIERNPISVGMAREPADYPFSSAVRGKLAYSAW